MLSTFSRTLKALALLAVGLSTAAQAQETVSVFSYNGARQATTVSVPKNPERVVVIDYAVLDIMDTLGLGDKIVGTAKGVAPDYLSALANSPKSANVGTVTCAAAEAEITIRDERCRAGRLALLIPLDAAAASAVWWLSAMTQGSMTFRFAAPPGECAFAWALLGDGGSGVNQKQGASA